MLEAVRQRCFAFGPIRCAEGHFEDGGIHPPWRRYWTRLTRWGPPVVWACTGARDLRIIRTGAAHIRTKEEWVMQIVRGVRLPDVALLCKKAAKLWFRLIIAGPQ